MLNPLLFVAKLPPSVLELPLKSRYKLIRALRDISGGNAQCL